MRRASIYCLAGLLVAVSLTSLLAGSAVAQQRVIRPEVPSGMAPELRSRIAEVDTSLTPRSRAVHGGRVDAETGVVRARYRLDAPPMPRDVADPLSLVRTFADELGIYDLESELEFEDDLVLPHSRHLTFRQIHNGVPVFGVFVRINIGRNGRPAMVLNGFRPHVSQAIIPAASIGANNAARLIADHAGQAIIILGDPEQVIYPADPPRPAWHIIARAETGPEEWSVVIDAASGDILSWIDQRTHDHGHDADPDAATSGWPEFFNIEATASADGSGLVFDPDPLTTAGVEYGPPYIDADDADIPVLNAERIEVPLFDVALFTDGLYRLTGPHVDIVGDATAGGYAPPALDDAHGFRFTRGHEHFEAVNSYHHIDQSQRYVQTAVPELGIHDFPVRVNPRAWSADNSTYTPGADPRRDGFIRFGTGGIDDAEDAHVILHEYAHALLEVSARSLRGTFEGMALHEGWADYWAVSYTRELIETGAVPPRDWWKVFTWDGNETWNGRFLEHSGTYPDDATCTRGACNIYNDGTLWATTLMEVYDVLGRQVTDRLNLLSHLYLIAPVTMQDAAEAIIQADRDYHDGAHLSILLDVFGRRGFVQPSEFAPIVRHQPPPTTERSTGTLTFTAYVTGDASPEAVYFVRVDDGAEEERSTFDHQSDSTFVVDIPLSADARLIRYYIEAVGGGDARIRSPRDAPDELHTVETGPDLEPPEVSHEPSPTVSQVAWPATITARADDRTGIDSAWVEYASPYGAGSFGLVASGDRLTGSFPDVQVSSGAVFVYHIHVRDRAEAANVASVGPFSIEVVDDITIRRFRLECDGDGLAATGVTATGVWQCKPPDRGTRFAWEGHAAWHASSGDLEAEVSSLLIPTVRIRAADSPHLVFWHWYGFDGGAPSFPSDQNTVSTGGNVKYSTDGGLTWHLAVPEGGYPTAFLDSGAEPENPTHGTPAFGGHSYGWQREVVPLPAADSIRVRFDFMKHPPSSPPGVLWYVDDVTFVAERPVDEEPPEIISTPAKNLAVSAGAGGPAIMVEAYDNVGIASVVLPYVLENRDGGTVEEGEIRLPMSDTSATHFHGYFDVETATEAGTRATYSIVARDFDGNITRLGDDGSPLIIEYVHTERHNLLAGLQPTGGWWRAADRYRVDGAESTGRTSSLLTAPIDLAAGVASLRLELEHVLNIDDGLGGNVKISTDGGASWQVLEPEGGYGSVFVGEHRMEGEAVFTSAGGDRRRESFDFTPYQGMQAQIRIDFGATRPLRPFEQWVIHNLSLEIVAPTDEIETPRRWQLHANYPNPFGSSTTISWTVAEPAAVSIELFDVLGRRVDIIENAALSPDTYTVTYDGSRLAGGVYFLRMRAADVILTRQIVVAR